MKEVTFYLIIAVCLYSCSNNPPQPTSYKGTISFNANLSSGESISNYTAEYKAIFQSGARGAQTSAPWGSLNPTGSTYSFVIVDNPYFGLKALTDYGFETIFLNIPIITINQRNMPADISSLAFDHPTVIARFRTLLDSIHKRLNVNVKYIALGNEVDTYFNSHPSEWASYLNLVNDARNYIRSLNSSLLVGVTTTFDGASNKMVSQVATLNSTMDAVMLTYYPVNASTFAVRDPSSVINDVESMVTIANGKQVIVQEWGYPSSTFLGSSEQKQAEFYSNSIAEIKKRTASIFPFISFFKYRDWTSTYVQTMTGQTSGQSFYEFLSSLGLKKNDGNVKPALPAIESGIK